MSANDGGPEFPTGERLDGNGQVEQYRISGMSLRAWLAGMAMQGYLAGRTNCGSDATHYIAENIAKSSCGYADALISELNRKESE